jgi:hypothetical protein
MADLEAITNPFVPTAFVRQVVAAVVPLIDKDELRDGKSRADVFEALNPIVGHYTMADAFLAWRMLRTAQCASLYSEDSETSALYEAAYLLETFVARGWPSSADCVSARAAALKIDEEAEKAMGDDNDDAARPELTSDVCKLRSGHFHGERLSDRCGRGLPIWLDRALAERGAQ